MNTIITYLLCFQSLSTLCSAAVAPIFAEKASSTLPDRIVLSPVTGHSNLKTSLLNNIATRQTDIKEPIILKPIPKKEALASSLAQTIQVRQTTDTVPSNSIVLGYGSSEIQALVEASMKQKAILLEDIAGIKSVTCTENSVNIDFNDENSMKAASSGWPTLDFILVTYFPEGGCNTANDRGFYNVSAISYDNEKLSAIATSEKSSLDDQSEDAVVTFDSSANPSKRALNASFKADFNGTLIDTDSLKIVLDQVLVESDLHIKGQFGFNFLKFKASKATIDIDYYGATNLNVSTSVNAAFSSDIYNYSPFTASVSAFSIPGILDVGPIAAFTVGVEFAASGTVDATLGLKSEIANGQVHLDLLDLSSSSSSGWKPVTTVSSDVAAEVSLQLNPYLDLNLALGVKVFKNAIDLTAGFDVKPQIINAFSADLDFAYASKSGVVFNKPDGATCPNGAWFASSFNMDVIAYVGSIFTKTLFNINVPIFQSQCWFFAG